MAQDDEQPDPIGFWRRLRAWLGTPPFAEDEDRANDDWRAAKW